MMIPAEMADESGRTGARRGSSPSPHDAKNA